MKKQMEAVDHEELVELVTELQAKLKKKTQELTETRSRLLRAKSTIQRQKETIAFQRDRILSLYKESEEPQR